MWDVFPLPLKCPTMIPRFPSEQTAREEAWANGPTESANEKAAEFSLRYDDHMTAKRPWQKSLVEIVTALILRLQFNVDACFVTLEAKMFGP